MNSGGPLPSSSARVTCDTCGDRLLLIIAPVSIFSATHGVRHCGPRPQHGPHVTHCRTNLISSSLPQSFRLLRHNRHNRLIRHNRLSPGPAAQGSGPAARGPGTAAHGPGPMARGTWPGAQGPSFFQNGLLCQDSDRGRSVSPLRVRHSGDKL